jgi:hypothetical protein
MKLKKTKSMLIIKKKRNRINLILFLTGLNLILFGQDTIKSHFDVLTINKIIQNELDKGEDIMEFEEIVRKIGTFKLTTGDTVSIYDFSVPPNCSHCIAVFVICNYFHKKKSYNIYRVYEGDVELKTVIKILEDVDLIKDKREKLYVLRKLFGNTIVQDDCQ